LNKALRISILARDNFTCQYCGARAPDVELHVEHIISRYDGGSDHPSNLVAACSSCNLGKGKRSLQVDVSGTADSSCFPDFVLPEPEQTSKAIPPGVFDPERHQMIVDGVERSYFSAVMRELSHECDGCDFHGDPDDADLESLLEEDAYL